jgi:hypothetical protein
VNGTIVCRPVGCYLGNSALTYLFCRAHAEKVGAELQCDHWIGERIFNVPHNPVTVSGLPTFKSTQMKGDETNIEIRCYAMNSNAAIYAKRQAQEWLTFRPECVEWCEDYFSTHAGLGGHWAHWRRMDFEPLNFPLVSMDSYLKAHAPFGGDEELRFTSWEQPMRSDDIPEDLFMLLDFYALTKASMLFRANSTFSWLAGLLSKGRVFSPVMTGCIGGMENDCPFVEGNWPAVAPWFDECTDMHIKESAA